MEKEMKKYEFDEPIVVDAEEAKREADYGAEVYVHEFKKPFKWEGKTYASLTFNFGKLTGADSLKIEGELKAMGWITVVPALDPQYKIRVAARACTERLGTDAFEAMPLGDFNRIMGRVQGFFMASE